MLVGWSLVMQVLVTKQLDVLVASYFIVLDGSRKSREGDGTPTNG